MGEVINELEADDFYSNTNKTIYTHMCRLFAEGKDINLTLIVNSIGKDNLKSAGGITYISDIITGGLNINPAHYINIVKEKSYRRKVIKELTKAVEKIYDEKNNPYEITDAMVNILLNKNLGKSNIMRDNELFESYSFRD